MKSMSLFLCVMVAGVSVAGETRSPVATVAFEFTPRGHILVPVTINGRYTQDFVFDTGAGMTALNEPRIPNGTFEEHDLESAQLNRAHASVTTQKVNLASLESAGILKEQVSAILMDLTDVEAGGFETGGVLGHNFFAAYDIEIDYPNQRLTFYSQDENHACSGTPFELVHGTHIKFKLNLGDVVVPAILDTGSPTTAINSLAADALLPGASEQLKAAKKAHQTPVNHAHAADYLGQLGIGSVAVGQQLMAENHPTNVVNLPVFDVFGMGSEPGALVGADVLKKRKLMINYSCQTLRIM